MRAWEVTLRKNTTGHLVALRCLRDDRITTAKKAVRFAQEAFSDVPGGVALVKVELLPEPTLALKSLHGIN